jgi:hypothetical protein
LGFYAHIGEFSKVLIEGGRRRVFSRSGCGDQAVHEMNLRSSVAVQGVEMNPRLVDFNTRAGDECAQRRSDISTWMLIERLQYKHALGQDSRQYHNHRIAAVAGVEQLPSGLCVLFMVLY